MGGLLSAPLIMPCAARPCHVTRDADTPPRAPAALVTVVLVLPGARGVGPPRPVAGVALSGSPEPETSLGK